MRYELDDEVYTKYLIDFKNQFERFVLMAPEAVDKVYEECGKLDERDIGFLMALDYMVCFMLGVVKNAFQIDDEQLNDFKKTSVLYSIEKILDKLVE